MTPSEMAAYLLVIVTLLGLIMREWTNRRDVAVILSVVASYKSAVDKYDKRVRELIKVVGEKGAVTERAKELELEAVRERKAMKEAEEHGKNIREGSRFLRSLMK
jgi:hypothetical protein